MTPLLERIAFIDALVARGRRSPINDKGEHYVKMTEDDFNNLHLAADELYRADPDSWRSVPEGEQREPEQPY